MLVWFLHLLVCLWGFHLCVLHGWLCNLDIFCIHRSCFGISGTIAISLLCRILGKLSSLASLLQLIFIYNGLTNFLVDLECWIWTGFLDYSYLWLVAVDGHVLSFPAIYVRDSEAYPAGAARAARQQLLETLWLSEIYLLYEFLIEL